MTMTIDDAASWIADVLKARVEAVAVHPEGGWTFEASGIPAYGSSLIENHDKFDYCLLDTENDEEIGRHNETMMFVRAEPDNRTLLIEGHYSRALGDHRDNADANFVGRMAMATRVETSRMTASFANGFSDRTLDAQMDSMEYACSGLQTARFYRGRALTPEQRQRLLSQIADVNRAALALLETSDAA